MHRTCTCPSHVSAKAAWYNKDSLSRASPWLPYRISHLVRPRTKQGTIVCCTWSLLHASHKTGALARIQPGPDLQTRPGARPCRWASSACWRRCGRWRSRTLPPATSRCCCLSGCSKVRLEPHLSPQLHTGAGLNDDSCEPDMERYSILHAHILTQTLTHWHQTHTPHTQTSACNLMRSSN